MNRYCFQLQVRPDRIDEYRRRHAAVWPDMQAALTETGWHNYSLFLRDDGLLIGYVESVDLAASVAVMNATEVNARWQAEMGELFVDLDVPPDQGFLLLEEVFHLEEGSPLEEPPGPDPSTPDLSMPDLSMPDLSMPDPSTPDPRTPPS